MGKKKPTKRALRREMAFLEGKMDQGVSLTPAEMTRWGELISALVRKPTKAEEREYRRQWIAWKRTLRRLRDAGCLDPDTDEPIFAKSV